ncbi:50S ribosomal protein L23 [Liquorilactobacillus nagelii]|jgi:large subunit ribosomal protein L23|uniref:Large ribosomal subunit protein uL23 n=1 Tax=Liquorilactobacillus nagelii TaxID=82688 RepID=A0A3S6QT47_9LACO|nr:50S ribosomal protein L23 [Liquorilactobacillus nagelii]AUJ31311.1 50S ribosomal protein L23 [Liquorilactobacillus nagelii]KRL40352.1 50S ribosomal protein L23 [Liquorilactobacillus nagelii DSM 13675]MCC7616878.1 50S ribosomal protein L23 [Liquorilactobacillus nagelii]MCI1633483.1 50S ribosomal protein L23 [Liquorilactobacillus nagelii]MCI1700342.1 50S ribosomal protein L23 [Liquorilactobacillus nagelii]
MESHKIILKPVITEASTAELDNKRYTFDVDTRATKPQIKKAIEEVFDVKVVKLNVINVKGKPKRMGRYNGYTKKRRKAIVTLSADSKAIKIFEE